MVSKTQMIGQSLASEESHQKHQVGTAPEPDAPVKPVEADAPPASKAPLDPTRYGDWEKNGRCIDF